MLREQYQHLVVSSYNWFTCFNAQQKESARRKFLKACVVESGMHHDEDDSVFQGEEGIGRHCLESEVDMNFQTVGDENNESDVRRPILDSWRFHTGGGGVEKETLKDDCQQSENYLADKDLRQSTHSENSHSQSVQSEISVYQNIQSDASSNQQLQNSHHSELCPSENESTCGANVEEHPKKELTIDLHSASQQTGVPMLVLQFMWTKAAELLYNHQVLPAPGCSPLCCMVASKSTHKPHFVSANKDGRFECNDLCPQRYICAHTVAAAENNNMLKGFIKSYGKFAKTSKGQ